MKSIHNIKQNIRKSVLLSIVVLAVTITSINAYPSQGELTSIIDLEGKWKFSIGERSEWLNYNYDDDDWETMHVPESWEDQGFHGYNGYATYRKAFTLGERHEGLMLYLGLGYIDDVDEVFVNGHKIGSSGSFPPRYETAFNARRQYYMPNDILNFDGKNVIVVVVYDAQQQGGIVGGDVGIYTTKFGMKVDISLQGKWRFHIHDNLNWAAMDYDDSDWDELFVPGKWEDQQYRDYDGYAWYRTSFQYSKNLGDHLVMLLGKIDDLDQVFINGHLIGGTGDLSEEEDEDVRTGSEFNAFRGYYVPKGLIKPNKKNVIAVRVYDGRGVGGIYEGPIGVITQDNYIDFWRNKKKSR